MTERLIIRLASKASQKNHWLIWSESGNEIIASGEVDNAEQLNLLTEKAQQRRVICLVPGADVSIKEIAINGPFNRQMQQALPYLVEEELAADVDTLHFSVIAKDSDSVHAAICEKDKIVTWLAWLEAAQIRCRQFIPEGLALPVGESGQWQALQLDNEWIVRENQNMAWSCEPEMLDLLIAGKSADDALVKIESYSQRPANCHGEWTELLPVLPLEVLARGTLNNKINLLSGEFKPKKESNKQLEKWRVPAILAITLFVVLLLNLYLKNTRVEQQTELVKEHVEAVYKQAFPVQSALQYARIKKKISTMLIGLEGDVDSGFLVMLNDLVPAFAAHPEFTANNIKFDSKTQEMRIAASADNFQAFEKFNAALAANFTVEQGALSSNKEGVSGLLTIRNK